MDSIAVVGLAVRLPQDIESAESFWELLVEGRSTHSEIPKQRLNTDAFFCEDGERSDAINTRSGHFITADPGAFDAPFFSMQPVEARSVDPQQRFTLEVTYRALENAGIPMESLAGSRTAVYMATSNRDYEIMLHRDPEQQPKYMGTGVGTSILANRVSWFFDCRGPSIAIDTACSGSLTGFHLACQSLRSGESDMAIVGGGSLTLSPDVVMSQLSTLGFLSPDGISYSFDHRANGYSKGEGFGVVILKRVGDAVKANDTIRAVVRATAINQDGRTPGLTQPSKQAQTENILQAYRAFDLDPAETQYFEAHGTGTAVGDPLEAEGIYNAFKRAPERPLYVGSVKANIGHLESGAGIASIVKSVLMLENGVMPPNAYFEKVNPMIPAAQWGLHFLTQAAPFPAAKQRRISINNFGYGGSNAHAVLDDAYHFLRNHKIDGKHVTAISPAPKGSNAIIPSNGFLNGHADGHANSDTHGTYHDPDPGTRPFILCLSSSDEKGINRIANDYERYFKSLSITDPNEQQAFLHNLSYSLSTRRSELAWKSTFTVNGFGDLKTGIRSKLSKPTRASRSPVASFIFTGQGAQWYAMTRGLHRWPVFRASLERSDLLLAELGCEWSIREELDRDEKASRIDDPEFAQPATTVLQIALVDLLASWGVRPRAVTGHSSGEIGAAYCALALSHRSAVRAAFWRGRVVSQSIKQGLQTGGMLAVGLSESEVMPHVVRSCHESGSRISVGCVNSAKNVTITGDMPGIDHLELSMEAGGIFARKLKINTAYHSHHMQILEEEYLSHITGLAPPCSAALLSSHPRMFSSVTGKEIDITELSVPQYWTRNLVGTVRFADSVRSMVEYLLANRTSGAPREQHMLLEIGPHAALQRPVKDIISSFPGVNNLEYDCIINRPTMPDVGLVSAIGRMNARGFDVDLVSVNTLDSTRASLKTLPDLPAYPFNHEQSYWAESRLSTKYRLKQQRRHDLLGSPEVDWNRWKPKWRNVIRVADNPWLQQHIVSGVALYPASGFLTMAIEGARQIAGPDAPIANYHLQEVNFRNSLAIPEGTDSVEVALHFQPRDSDATGLGLSYDFSIMIVNANNDWTEACYGTIDIEQNSLRPSTTDGLVDSIRRLGLGDLLDLEKSRRWDGVGSEEYYDNIAKMSVGLRFENSFQTLNEIRFDGKGQATAKIRLGRWATLEPQVPSSSHVIHPTDLDGLMQTALAGYSRGGRRKVPILVPTKIKSIRISHALLTRKPETEMQTSSKTAFTGFRESDFSVAAIDDSRQLGVIVDGFRQTVIDLKQGPDTRTVNDVRRHAYHISYKPELDLIDKASLTQLCASSMNWDKIPSTDMVDRIELVCLHYMKQVTENITDAEVVGMPQAFQYYVRWVKSQLNGTRLETLRRRSVENEDLFYDEERRKAFLTRFVKDCAQGPLIVKSGESLLEILRGKVDALDLLFADSTVDAYYENTIAPPFEGFVPIVDMLAHENHQLRVLEIGAGTGSSTLPVLRTLQGYPSGTDGREPISRVDTYLFTDISPAFFEPAKQKLGKLAQNVEFSVLDIEKDPILQGFEEGKFDVIIASGVLHATADLNNTLTNVRKLLKPGGKVLIFEPTAVNMVHISFIFGLLPGWWLGTDVERDHGPIVSADTWNRLLQQNGFMGDELMLSDNADPERQCFSCILSTALPRAPDRDDKRPISIIINQGVEKQAKVAYELSRSYSIEQQVYITSLEEITIREIKNHFCISLVDYSKNFFHEIDERDWDVFKSLVAAVDRMLWVSLCAGEDDKDAAEDSLAIGIARNVNSEKMGSRWIQISLEADSCQNHFDQIRKVFDFRIIPNSNLRRDTEYKEISGVLCVPRLTDADNINQHIESATEARLSQPQCFGSDPSRPLKLAIGAPGLLDTFEFDDDPTHGSPLLESEVEIEVAAAGIDEKDVYVALGQVTSDRFGSECSGRVIRAGAKSSFQVGDEVCALSLDGALKTFVRTDDWAVMKIPRGMTMQAAAALPLALATAYYSLVMIADLQQGESVLIHNAAGAIGQASIQIAQQKDARIFTTVETDVERALLVEKYGLMPDDIFSSRDTTFARVLMNKTGAGIDVIVSSLLSHGQAASWNCIAPLGRFIEVGKSDISKVRRGLQMDKFERSVSFTSIDMAHVLKNPALAGRIVRGVSAILHGSSPIPAVQPLRIYRLSQLENAFRSAQQTIHYGKVVIEIDKDAVVQVLPSTKLYSFVEDATYVIAGGLGGLGRSIVEWMFSRGARNFVLLSRSGGDATQKSRDLVADLQGMGARVETPRCDITDAYAVQNVIRRVASIMPPIRGCLQASMVLKDGLFESMTLENWHAVLRPKTTGTANLSTYLPKDMDFFVLFSSTGSILGTRGQGNYGVANTYLDTMARNLAAKGRHCISLNLGPILSVGYVAENDLRASFRRDGFECITRDEFMSLLEYACDPSCPSARNPATAQIVTGLRSAQTLAADRFGELYWTQKAMLQPLLQVNTMANRDSNPGAAEDVTSITALLAAASTHDEVAGIALEALIGRFAKLLAVPRGEVDFYRPVIASGIDSLVALELRYWVAREFGATVSVFEIINAKGLHDLAEIVAGRLTKKEEEEAKKEKKKKGGADG